MPTLSRKKHQDRSDPVDEDMPTFDLHNIDDSNEVQVMFLSQDFAPMQTEAKMINA